MSPLSASVLAHNPAIQTLLVAPTEAKTKRLAADYDLAICLHSGADTLNYLNWLSIDSWVVPIPPEGTPHQAQYTLEYIAAGIEGCKLQADDQRYHLYPQPENFQKIEGLLQEHGVDLKRPYTLIGCHLGCHSISKQRTWKIWQRPEHRRAWPLENFILLDKKLHQHDANIRLVLTGSQGEIALGKKFQRHSPSAINLVDQTSVLDMAALMHYLSAYLTGDTGPLHVACSTKVPVVAMYNLTIAARLHPYPMRDCHTMLFGATTQEISVEEVYAALLKAIKN